MFIRNRHMKPKWILQLLDCSVFLINKVFCAVAYFLMCIVEENMSLSHLHLQNRELILAIDFRRNI